MRTTRSTTLSPFVPLACLAVLASPRVASAQEVSAADHEQAVTNFQAGRGFVEKNNCKEAIPYFIKSLRFESSVGARFNLAECSRAEQHNADAWNQFKQAQQSAIAKADTERRDSAQKAISELDPKVLKIRMTLPDGVAGLVVKIDGREVPSVDHELLKKGYALEPDQPHRIDVTASNRNPWTSPAPVKGAPGQELAVIAVDLGDPIEPEGAEIGASQRRKVGLIVGAVGLAGVAVGSVFGLLAIGAKSKAKNACESPPQGDFTTYRYPNSCFGSPAMPNQKAVDYAATAKTDATISTIAFIAGGVLLAGGAVLYFTAPKGSGKEAARLHLAPAVGPGTAGALLGGTF